MYFFILWRPLLCVLKVSVKRTVFFLTPENRYTKTIGLFALDFYA